MKKKIFIIFFCVPIILFCQNPFRIDIKIADSLVVKKKYPSATKINVEINFPDFHDTMYFYLFNKCVYAFNFWSDSLVDFFSRHDVNFEDFGNSVGLAYSLVDENNEVILGDCTSSVKSALI